MYAMTLRQIPCCTTSKVSKRLSQWLVRIDCSMAVDFPLLLYPSVKREMDFSLFIHDINQNAGLSEQEWIQFMGKICLDLSCNIKRRGNA